MIINSILSEYLNQEPKKREIGVYYPSRLPYCLRQQWLEWKSESLEWPEDLLRIFELGNLFQNFLKQVFEASKEIKLVKNEVPFSVYIVEKGIFIKGRMDEIVILEKNGETFIIEVKTHRNLEYLKSPHEEHLKQLNFYLKMIPKAKGLLVYIQKNDLKIKEFQVDFNQKLFEELILRAGKLHEHLLENKMPEPEAKLKESMKWQCNYCLFRKDCEVN